MESLKDASDCHHNGFVVLVQPNNEDEEQYEVLDNAQSEFLQHFENEIRISPLCVGERCMPANSDPTSAVSDGCTAVALQSRCGSSEGALVRPHDGTSYPALDIVVVSQAPLSNSSSAAILSVGDVTCIKKPSSSAVRCPGGAKSSARRGKDVRDPPLSMTFAASAGPYELKIIKQPEDQHRARYLTEGSRGTVKDKSQLGHPTVKLTGYDQVVVLHVFIGTETGRLKPHGFYQACKVSGKNSTPCVERDIEGTTVIEILLEPKNDMVAVIDCMGILKLRNADVEQRIGLAKSKKKSTSARLIFRVNIPKPDGTLLTLQVASTPILCTQPVGAPEISKKSISQCCASGGDEMFIIGKNFVKGMVVTFEEVINNRVVWTSDADIDQDFFQATHLVCRVPAYHPADSSPLSKPKEVQIVVHSNGRSSEPVPFVYVPDSPSDVMTSRNHVTNSESNVTSTVQIEQSNETEQDKSSSTSSDGSSLKRPYESSSEDLTDVVKSAGSCNVKLELAALPDSVGTSTATPGLPAQPNIHQQILYQHMVDTSACLATPSAVEVCSDQKSSTISVPYSSPPLHGQGPGGGNYMNEMYDASSIIQAVSLTGNFQHPTMMKSMDYVDSHSSGILLDDGGKLIKSSDEPQPKRHASLSGATTLQDWIQMVGGGDKESSDDKMQWGHVAVGAHPVESNQTAAVHGIAADSFAFPTNIDPGRVDAADLMFNFGHSIVFNSPFPGDVPPPTGGSSFDVLGELRMLNSVAPQSMETNIGMQQAMESAVRMQDAMSMISSAQNNVAQNTDSQIVIGMEISGGHMSAAAHPSSLPLQNPNIVSTPFTGSDPGITFASVAKHPFDQPADMMTGFLDGRSEVRMDISMQQIAGMNLPDSLTSPLSIVTSSLNDESTLQQSLVELMNLQQQVSGGGNSAGTGAASNPSSPPYRKSSFSRHDTHHDQSSKCGSPDAVWNTAEKTASQWSSPTGYHVVVSTSSVVNSPGMESGSGAPGQQGNALTSPHSHMYSGDGHSNQEIPHNHLYGGDNNQEMFATTQFAMTPTDVSHESRDGGAYIAGWASQMMQPSGYIPNDAAMLPSNHFVIVAEQSADEKPFANYNPDVDHRDSIVNELFIQSRSTNDCNIPGTISGIHRSPDNSVYSILVQSDHSIINSSPVSPTHVTTDCIQPVFSSMSDTAGSMPGFLLIAGHQSGIATNNGQATAINTTATVDMHESANDGLCSRDMQQSSSENHESANKVPMMLYKLLTEDTVPQSNEMTSSASAQLATHQLPDLSFDDINQILNNSQTTQS